MSAIEALIKIAAQIKLNVLDIISIRPEDGSGKRWLYKIEGETEEYYIEIKNNR